MNEMDLSTLIPALRRGDKEAFAVLFRRYYPKVRGFAFRILGEKWEAEDVAQNVFYKIWCLRGGLHFGEGNIDVGFNAYVFMIARNEAIDLLRSQKTIRAFQEKFLQEISTPRITQAIDERMDLRRRLSLINEIVSSMPRVRREVFVMSRFKNKSNEVIAEFLGISRRTVERHISLSLKQIRIELANQLG